MENDQVGDQYLDEVYHLLGAKKARSFRAVVDEKKKELGISSDFELSKLVGIPNNTMGRLIDEETQKVDLFNKLLLCRFLGIKPADMLDNYVSSLGIEHTKKLEFADKANFIKRTFDLVTLKKIGFIKSATDLVAVERRLIKFFGLTSILHYGRNLPAALYSRVKQYSKSEMRTMWLFSAATQFQSLKRPYAYDHEALLALIPKIRLYTLDEEKGLILVLRALYRVGVTVIIQKYLSNTGVRGASFVIDDKPCIVLTDFRQSYSTLWFSLLHELYHVLFDFKELKSWTFHLSGDEGALSDDLFREEMADGFARDRLLSKAKLDFIKPHIDSPGIIRQYADSVRVHPSIIYSFHCYDEKYNNGRDVYARYQHLFGSSEKAVRLVRLTPYDGDEDTAVLDNLDSFEAILNFSSDKPKSN